MGKLAPSLRTLFATIDALWPNRNRGIDGWYHAPGPGPQGHMPTHNGYSHAIDVDVRGINPPWIINHIIQRSDVMHYIIWDVRVWSVDHGWNGHPYQVPKGGSLHKDHMHIETYFTTAAENYNGPWFSGSGGGGGGGGNPGNGGELGNAGLSAADPRDYRGDLYEIGNQFDWGGWRADDGANSIRQSRDY